MKIGASCKLNSKISICVVPLLIATLLCLNFFMKPAACPMNYAGGGMSMGTCDCCSGCCRMTGHLHNMPGMHPEMSCRCGTYRIAGRGILPSPFKGGAMIYLQKETVSSLPPSSAKTFREYKADAVMFLLGEEKDRPPQAS